MGLSFNRASLLAVAATVVSVVSVVPAAAADLGVEQYDQRAYQYAPPPPPPVAVAPAPVYVVPPRYAPLYGCVGCAPLYPYPVFGYRYGPYRPRYYAGHGPWHRHW